MVATPLSSSENAPARQAGRPFGRFRLLQLLGRSEHSMAWLAFDPRLEQEVMLTMPRVQPTEGEALAQWQHRVKSALRLSHPNLAHVVEVGVESHWPFVTVDRALGVTWDEWLPSHPPLSAMQAVEWVCQCLEGLAFAHEAGMAHGDVELYLLSINEHGSVRWLGTGVASASALRVEADARSAMDPRTLQAQRALAARDVLAVGVLLQRLLCGQMPLEQNAVGAVLARLPPQGNDQVRLPRNTPNPVPEALRVIANRATSSQENHRYLSARTFLRALQGWRESETQGGKGPLDVLMERIDSVGHLPSMSNAGRTLTQLMRGEAQRNDEITGQILQDMGLTLEMLRQVNSAQVQSSQGAGATPVITVRRAVALMGMNGVRRCSASLREWPGPLSEPAATALGEAMERVRLAGGIAQALAPAGYDPEVVYLATLMQNLGRLLVQYHLPDEAEQIFHLMKPTAASATAGVEQPGLSEVSASFGVLGASLEALGGLVVKRWGLGADVQHMMHRLPAGSPVRAPDTDVDWLRIAASAANEVVDIVTLLPTTQWNAALATVAQRYARTLTIDAGDLHEALKQARDMVRRGGVIRRASALEANEPRTQSEEAAAVGTPQPATGLRARLLAKTTKTTE